jgi:site-specific DNA recombinase
MSIAMYVRVSTQRQAQTQTIEQQLERLQAQVQSRGWEVPAENVFRDDGYSGATLNRPGLDRLRDQVKAAEIDRVLVTAPDRLARNYVQQMVLLEELEHAGCEVEFLDRPMSHDPHDQLLLQIRGAVAEYERTLIAERMRRGRQTKLRAGVLLPWTWAPYGYRMSSDHPRDPAGVQVDEAEASVVQEMFAWYAEDHSSLLGLAKHLTHTLALPSPQGKKRWNPATIRGILTNPAYTGHVYAGRTRSRAARVRRSATHPIGHPHDSQVPTAPEAWIPVASIPAIVSQAQFDAVQAKLAQNQSFARRNNKAHTYLLRALVSCGVCRSSCIARTVHARYDYYTCRAKGNPIQTCRDEKCPARYVPAHQLDELVWQDLCDVMQHPESITHALERAHGGHWLPQELQARRENLRKGHVNLEHQLDRLSEAYLQEVMPLVEYQRRRRELEQKAQALATQEQQLDGHIDHQAQLAALAASVEAFCQRVQAGLANATFEQKRQLVELLIDRVIVTDAEVEICYVIPTSPSSEHTRFCHLRKDYFDFPAPAVAAQFAPVLSGRLFAVAPMGRNQVHPAARQPAAQRIAVIGLVHNHAFRLLAWPTRTSARDGNRRQGWLQQGHFPRGGRIQVDSQRNTLAVDHHHPLCAFPALGFPDSQPPFFAGAKLPSAKASLQSSRVRWSSVPRKARQISNHTSCSSHICNRRQQVDGLGYWSGKSCQRAPVRKIHRIPSKHGRLGAHGWPPFLDLGKGGNSGPIRSHCLSVKSGLRCRRGIASPPPLLSHTFTSGATPLLGL